MRRTLIVIGILVAAVSLVAADHVQQRLNQALNGEKNAEARYAAFALKAKEEGYLGVANLFKACERAESIHARKFEQAILDRGEAPTFQVKPVEVRGTEENLRSALGGEKEEVEIVYRLAGVDAQKADDADIAALFELVRTTEIEHSNLCTQAGNQLEELKQPKPFFVCNSCGYTTDVSLRMCPACRKGHLTKVGID